jgi:hypothetical protein
MLTKHTEKFNTITFYFRIFLLAKELWLVGLGVAQKIIKTLNCAVILPMELLQIQKIRDLVSRGGSMVKWFCASFVLRVRGSNLFAGTGDEKEQITFFKPSIFYYIYPFVIIFSGLRLPWLISYLQCE